MVGRQVGGPRHRVGDVCGDIDLLASRRGVEA